MTGVYARTASGWSLDFENGHLWPTSPAEGRAAHGEPFQTLTGVSGAGVGNGPQPVAFVAGRVSTAVRRLRASSSLEQHWVDLDPATGIFVALTLQEHPIGFTLTAFDASCRELDAITYSPPD